MFVTQQEHRVELKIYLHVEQHCQRANDVTAAVVNHHHQHTPRRCLSIDSPVIKTHGILQPADKHNTRRAQIIRRAIEARALFRGRGENLNTSSPLQRT